jgi:Flp pilus assembly protein CpaB
MQRSRLPLTLALVAFALTLVSGAYAYNQLLRTVPVLVASQDIPVGAELVPEMVWIERVPAGGRPDRALFGPGQVSGKYAAVPLFAGELLTDRHVTADKPRQDPLAAAGKEQRVVSVPVKAEAVLGGALRPGDTVDVTAAWPGQDGKPGAVETLAAGVRVVDVRNAAAASTLDAKDSAGPEGAVPTSVLLLVNVQQGRVMVGAVESKATLYLWLAGRDAK